jgi:hypothetical protein
VRSASRAGAAGDAEAQLVIPFGLLEEIFDSMSMTLSPAYDNSGGDRLKGTGRMSGKSQAARPVNQTRHHGELPVRAECDPDHRHVIQVIGENVCGRAWIYATLML